MNTRLLRRVAAALDPLESSGSRVADIAYVAGIGLLLGAVVSVLAYV